MLAAIAAFVACMSPVVALADDTIAGVTTDSGDISTTGTREGSGQAAPSTASGTASTYSVTSIYVGCSEKDPAPCATEMSAYCPGAPVDGPVDLWRVSTTQVFAVADTARVLPLSTTTGCMNFFRAAAVGGGPSEAEVREWLVTVIPVSGAGTSPAPDASGMAQFVVNLPVIVFAVGDTEVVAGPVPLVGRDVEVSARAVSFEWAVGPSRLVSDVPGSPFSGLPCSREDCSAYLHVGPIAVPGRHSITLTTTWAGRYRVDGGAWVDIAAPIVKVSAPTVLNLREARGVLVYN